MDDLIRRSDVMPAVEAALELYPSECDAISEKVDAILAVDPESLRARGKWEWYEEWNESTTDNPAECQCAGWACSECGIDLAEYLEETTHEIVYLDDPGWRPKMKFCPHCGMRMEEDDG